MKPIVSSDVNLNSRRDLKNGYLSLTFGPFPRIRSIKPGQFVHIGISPSATFYRRAYSVAGVNLESREVELIIKVIGRGTRQLSRMRPGENRERVNFLGPLGNPFTSPAKHQSALLVAGGVGYPPLLFLAASLIERGHDPDRVFFLYGGKSTSDVVDRARIRNLGVNFIGATEDGSFGRKGMITAELVKLLSSEAVVSPVIYSCGPETMLKAVDQIATEFETPGQLALEAPMPCGIGICLGCVLPLKSGGFARVCQEGPVFETGTLAL
ncbi:MAG: dihydroorotate dehydrogenase electron transfer subunit [Candidatus Zixiibacteriota bacterium]